LVPSEVFGIAYDGDF
jgi:hypothetical protein